MKLWIFLAAFVSSSFSARAETVGILLSDPSAKVLVQNGQSADGDFLWDSLAVPVGEEGLKKTKSYRSEHRNLSVACSRAETQPAPVTSCTVSFAKNPSFGAVVDISKATGRITGVFPPAVAEAFSLNREFVVSPDGRLTLCTVCGVDGAGLPFSIVWQK